MIAAGLSYKEIATQLSIAEQTVAVHAHSMRSKLAVRNNASLVAAAVVYGLLSSSEFPLSLL